MLWLCADIIWASYELVFHIAAPIPSLSDILWLAGYPFLAYNLISTYKQFHNKFNKRVLLASVLGNIIFVTYLISLTIGLSDFSSAGSVSLFVVLIAYPIMNAGPDNSRSPNHARIVEGKTLVHTLDIQIFIFVLHSDNRQLVRIHNTFRLVRTGMVILYVLWGGVSYIGWRSFVV